MPVEAANFISQLDQNSPTGAEFVNQGDNHLRLLKAVLLGTFPNAGKAFRFPTGIARKTGNYTVQITDDNALIPVNATGGNVTITLPAGTAALDGFRIRIVRVDQTVNTLTVIGQGNSICGIAAAVGTTIVNAAEGLELQYHNSDGSWWGGRFDIRFVSAFAGGSLTTFTDALDAMTTALASRVTSGQGIFRIRNTTTGAALLEFLRAGSAFVSYFGLDTDNTLRYGGGSLGAVAYKVFHQGQLPDTTEVSGLAAALAAKANTAHTHAQSDITGLVAALAAKTPITSQTAADATDYDVGTILLAEGDAGDAQQNQTVIVRRGTSPGFRVNITGGGTVLSGTWKVRGGGSTATTTLVQRTA